MVCKHLKKDGSATTKKNVPLICGRFIPTSQACSRVAGALIWVQQGPHTTVRAGGGSGARGRGRAGAGVGGRAGGGRACGASDGKRGVHMPRMTKSFILKKTQFFCLKKAPKRPPKHFFSPWTGRGASLPLTCTKTLQSWPHLSWEGNPFAPSMHNLTLGGFRFLANQSLHLRQFSHLVGKGMRPVLRAM